MGIVDKFQNKINTLEQKAVDAMFALRRSQSFYEPSYKPMTSISVNDMPPRDTYAVYGNNPDPRSIDQQSFFPYHQAGGAGSREGQVMSQLANQLNGYVTRLYFRWRLISSECCMYISKDLFCLKKKERTVYCDMLNFRLWLSH